MKKAFLLGFLGLALAAEAKDLNEAIDYITDIPFPDGKPGEYRYDRNPNPEQPDSRTVSIISSRVLPEAPEEILKFYKSFFKDYGDGYLTKSFLSNVENMKVYERSPVYRKEVRGLPDMGSVEGLVRMRACGKKVFPDGKNSLVAETYSQIQKLPDGYRKFSVDIQLIIENPGSCQVSSEVNIRETRAFEASGKTFADKTFEDIKSLKKDRLENAGEMKEVLGIPVYKGSGLNPEESAAMGAEASYYLKKDAEVYVFETSDASKDFNMSVLYPKKYTWKNGFPLSVSYVKLHNYVEIEFLDPEGWIRK